MNRRLCSLAFPVAVLAFLAAARLSAAEDAPRVDFNRDIRPLLSNRCFACHGPDEKQRQAGLRLDLRDQAIAPLESGETAIVPGKPAESELYRRITADDEFTIMPPADSGKSLSKEELELLRRWIEQGADYQAHWSFVTPARPPVPRVEAQRNDYANWPRNDIDRFILARLLKEGLVPTPEADRRTLIRRVTLELTGLPPTRYEIEQFLADESPDAYEKLVDRLLASPHYGEHMARYWLDAVRYGDTHGLHLDNYREIWPYRDWVIRAFNENKPYDEFIIEQLAGDLLPDPSIEQLVATGFNRCNVSTNEGGAIEEEFYVRNVVDRVEAFATVFLGLTAGCAVCHDHKFDPFTQRDFYSLFAFFNSIDGRELDGNRHDHAPAIRVPGDEQKPQLARIETQLAAIRRSIAERGERADDAFEHWLADVDSATVVRPDIRAGLVAHFPLDEPDGDPPASALDPKRVGRLRDKVSQVEGRTGRALRFDGGHADLGSTGGFERDRAFSYGAWIRTGGRSTGAAIARMDVANDNRGWDLYVAGRKVAAHLIHHWPENVIKVTTQQDVLKPDEWHHVIVAYDGSSRAAGVTIYVDGQPADVDVNNDSLTESIVADTPLRLGTRSRGAPFLGGSVDDVRLYDRHLSAEEAAAIAAWGPIEPILAIEPPARTKGQIAALRRHYLESFDEPLRELVREERRLLTEKSNLEAAMPQTLIFRERSEPKPAYVLIRGEYTRKGEQVARNTPAALPPMADDLPLNRLGLAQWLVAPEHPLTARVAVNRFWQQCFGAGIVKTSGDFGAQGEWPAHPELLDWLAVEFRELGWDVKRLMKLIVTSATYRQSSHVSPELLRKDPENRLLARGPRFRLDAEVLRDQALAASGLLVRKMGGPGVKPPQPAGLWASVAYTGSNTARFQPDTGEKIYRRSVYTFWKRTSPPPAMTTFDAPSRESCQVRRELTNTPLQALVLMNEVQFFESARHLAQRAMREGPRGTEERIAWLFEEVTARPPVSDERALLLGMFRETLDEYRADPAAAKKLIHVGNTPPPASLPAEKLGAWTMVAHALLNLDEVVTKH